MTNLNEFLQWWQFLPYKINPVLFQLGFLQIRYYGLMFLLALLIPYCLMIYRVKKEGLNIRLDVFESFLTWAVLGVVLGGRLGYVLFYNLGYYLSHPLEIFWPLQNIEGQMYFGLSGMSYHGGVIGLILATYFFCRRYKINALWFSDCVIPAIPIGYMFGRIGNFLNGELYGRVTNFVLGMYFPGGGNSLRHPSQLYEAFGEGLFLFLILWILRKKKVFDGFLTAIYLIGYGLIRFSIEFFRAPDEQLGFVFLQLSMGQILCLAMVLGGVLFLIWKGREKHAL